MVIRLFAALLIAVAASLSGCASAPRTDTTAVYEPNYDGVYRLSYSAAGNALYYRFYPGGVVISARSEAPADEIISNLNLESAKVSRGSWSAGNGELRVGIEEGTVTYDSSFDIRQNGRIALRGLPRSFEFLKLDAAGNVIATR
jgi:hypothetical protein